MSALLPLKRWTLSQPGARPMVVMEVQYLAASDTVATDPSVTKAMCIHLEGGTAPDVAVGTPSGGSVNITIGANTAGTVGKILIAGVVMNGAQIGSGNG